MIVVTDPPIRTDDRHTFRRMGDRSLLHLDLTVHPDLRRDIVEIRMITKSYISKSVENLIKKGFLVRTLDKHDRRIIHLHLTDKSNPIIADARIKQKEYVKILFTGMTVDEIETFESLLTRIIDNANMAYNK